MNGRVESYWNVSPLHQHWSVSSTGCKKSYEIFLLVPQSLSLCEKINRHLQLLSHDKRKEERRGVASLLFFSPASLLLDSDLIFQITHRLLTNAFHPCQVINGLKRTVLLAV